MIDKDGWCEDVDCREHFQCLVSRAHSLARRAAVIAPTAQDYKALCWDVVLRIGNAFGIEWNARIAEALASLRDSERAETEEDD